MSGFEENLIVARLESLTEGVHAALVQVLKTNRINDTRRLHRMLVDRDQDFWIFLGKRDEVQALLERWKLLVQRIHRGRPRQHHDKMVRSVWLTFVRRLTLNPALVFVEKEGSSTDGLAVMQLFCSVCKHTVYTQFGDRGLEHRRARSLTPASESDDENQNSKSEETEYADTNPLYDNAVTIRFDKHKDKRF